MVKKVDRKLFSLILIIIIVFSIIFLFNYKGIITQTGFAISDYDYINEDPSLVGYWPFDYDSHNVVGVYDYSVWGTHGSAWHGVEYPVNGKFNKAYGFTDASGDDAYIFIPASDAFDSLDGTTESVFLWVKPNPADNADESVILASRSIISGRRLTYKGNKFVFSIADSETGNIYNLESSNLPKNQWYNVGYTISNKNVKLYINGLLEDEVTLQNNAWEADSYWTLGGRNKYFRGYIDEVMMFNRPLSTDELRDIYDGLGTGYDYIKNNIKQCKKILAPGAYTLTSDIETNFVYDCIVIEADNVILDCNNHKITTHFANSIIVNNSKNIEIRNCNLKAENDKYAVILRGNNREVILSNNDFSRINRQGNILDFDAIDTVAIMYNCQMTNDLSLGQITFRSGTNGGINGLHVGNMSIDERILLWESGAEATYNQHWTLQGLIKDEEGNSIPDVTIEVYNELFGKIMGPETNYNITVDSNGKFSKNLQEFVMISNQKTHYTPYIFNFSKPGYFNLSKEIDISSVLSENFVLASKFLTMNILRPREGRNYDTPLRFRVRTNKKAEYCEMDLDYLKIYEMETDDNLTFTKILNDSEIDKGEHYVNFVCENQEYGIINKSITFNISDEGIGADEPDLPVCGDGICEGDELYTCPSDCNTTTPVDPPTPDQEKTCWYISNNQCYSTQISGDSCPAGQYSNQVSCENELPSETPWSKILFWILIAVFVIGIIVVILLILNQIKKNTKLGSKKSSNKSSPFNKPRPFPPRLPGSVRSSFPITTKPQSPGFGSKKRK